MQRRAWRLRVQDVLDSIAAIQCYSSGMDREAFIADARTVDAVLHRIAVIGEAVSAVPDEIRDRYPAIPWRDIRNMRNVLTHVCFGVDLSRVWDVVERDLDLLASQLAAMLTAEADGTQ